ncbi:MAG: hypothetical protein K2X91_05910, partial [Thermoleophilia bacterium]|nr:hypothetical protein [Thermoleophilia bacterium]
MQKFTRELVREVEIGGERVALTLSEKGVAVRTVGSRKPPAEIGWEAVVAAARGGPAPSPAPLPPPVGLAETLSRLDAWLKANRPAMHGTLRPGAGEAELKKLADAWG